MKTIQQYFQNKHDQDLIEDDKFWEAAIEPLVIVFVIIYFLINLPTNFFIDDISFLIYFFIFIPFIAELASNYILLTSRSRQKSRLFAAFANGFTSISWLYLYFADKWYQASELWLIGGFVDDTIFKWLMIGGVVFPLFIVVSSCILYVKVKQIQDADLIKTNSET